MRSSASPGAVSCQLFVARAELGQLLGSALTLDPSLVGFHHHSLQVEGHQQTINELYLSMSHGMYLNLEIFLGERSAPPAAAGW